MSVAETNTGSSLRTSPVGPLLLMVAVAVAGYFFWSGIVSLNVAWQKPEYSHGYIIPLIAAFLILKRLPPADAEPAGYESWLGVVLVALGLAVGFIGTMAAVADIVTYGMLLVIFGLLMVIVGTRNGSRLWPGWLYLCFMLPLPNFIYWPLSIKLQFLSSKIGVALISMMGVPVYLDGNIIDLGTYQLQVAEACSGLRYLFPLASFGFLFAALYRGPLWHKIIIFLASIPITIGMNSARIGVIGFLVDRYGIEQAEGFLHFFEGWVIFLVCILLLFALTFLLQRISPNPQPIASVLDLDTRGLLPKLGHFSRVAVTRSLLIATVLICVAAAGAAALGARSVVYPERQRFVNFPMLVGDWSGHSSYLDFQIEKVLGADDYIMADYAARATPEPVNLLIAYYRSLNEGSGVHSPEVCIPAGGWEVSRWEQSKIALNSPAWNNLTVNRAIIQRGLDRQLVYYWFEQRGTQMTNDYVFKAHTVWGSVLTGRSDGAMIRVVTPIRGNDIEGAEKRLTAFLDTVAGTIHDFVPP